jgi:hypothetical protein
MVRAWKVRAAVEERARERWADPDDREQMSAMSAAMWARRKGLVLTVF